MEAMCIDMEKLKEEPIEEDDSEEEKARKHRDNGEKKMLTDKVASVMKDWGKFLRFGLALVNVKELNHAEQVINFFADPNPYSRHYALWSELGNPMDENSETWNMFVEAMINTDKDKNYGKQT